MCACDHVQACGFIPVSMHACMCVWWVNYDEVLGVPPERLRMINLVSGLVPILLTFHLISPPHPHRKMLPQQTDCRMGRGREGEGEGEQDVSASRRDAG